MSFYEGYRRFVEVLLTRANDRDWTVQVLEASGGPSLWKPAELVGSFEDAVRAAKRWAKRHGCKVVRLVWRV